MGVWSEIKAVARTIRNGAAALADPNFAAGVQFWTPGQPIWSDKDYRTFVSQGYKRNPVVYACINKIAGAAAGIDWKLYINRDRKNKETIDDHPLLDLWRKPNPRMPGSGSFIEQCFGYWHIAGNNYIWAYRLTPDSPPVAIWNLRPDRMKAVAGDTGVQSYVYGYDTNTPTIYELPEILHMKFPGYDDDIYGLSPIQVASYFADQQNEAMAWNTALMQNQGRPASVFFAKGILTPEQRNQIEQEIRKKYSGKRNAGRPLILEADMDWRNMSLTPMELDFLKSFELSTRQIAAILDIAPELVGDSAGKTFANVAEARQALYLENALPKLDRMSDYLNTWLVPMYPDLVARGAYFTYDRDDIEALQALYAAQEKARREMARADWLAGGLTLEEYCEAIGAAKPVYGAVRRFGAVLVSEESMEDYADQSLSEPAAPPVPLPEPLNVPGANPALPPGKKPAALPAPKAPKAPKSKMPVQKLNALNLETKALDANGVYQPDDLEEQLAALRAQGVEYITWQSTKYACDVCITNDGHTVEVGKPFPSGHILPQAHPNCDCDVIPAATLTGKRRVNPYQRKLQALALELGTERLLELITQYKTQRNGGYTVHEVYNNAEGSNHDTPDDYTPDARNLVSFPGQLDEDETGGALQLRFMPVQAAPGGMEADSSRLDETEPDSLTSGALYRAFINRYS